MLSRLARCITAFLCYDLVPKFALKNRKSRVPLLRTSHNDPLRVCSDCLCPFCIRVCRVCLARIWELCVVAYRVRVLLIYFIVWSMWINRLSNEFLQVLLSSVRFSLCRRVLLLWPGVILVKRPGRVILYLDLFVVKIQKYGLHWRVKNRLLTILSSLVSLVERS